MACGWALGLCLAGAEAARGQVPGSLYMQGLLLRTNGAPDPGAHSIQCSIYTNHTVVFTSSQTVTADAAGAVQLVISDPNLPAIFQGSTNTYFRITGGPTQEFVSTPYAFEAANLPRASGNFTVAGNLQVSSNAQLRGLTAENGGVLMVPMVAGGMAIFTNVAGVVFSGDLTAAGGLLVEGDTESNLKASFTSAVAGAVCYGNTNQVCFSNATIQTHFTVLTNDLRVAGTSDTATDDGFLLVWIWVYGHTTSGVKVQIGDHLFLLQDYCDEAATSKNLKIYTGATFPVPRGTTWQVGLANSGESSDLAVKCYWVPLRGDG
jgi:hypothetical protein